jgi:hypothetical protein
MSRGLGKLQRVLFLTIQRHGKPMTFNDIRAEAIGDGGFLLATSFERSIRRSLHRMVSDGGLIAIGGGGRADPYRYFIHPTIIAMTGTKEEFAAVMDALAADPGANEALKKASPFGFKLDDA